MNLIYAFFRKIGRCLAQYLVKPLKKYETFSVIDEETLNEVLQPGDILLIEGNSRVSTAIKYLTQSTWSHVCVYIGQSPTNNHHTLLEADLLEGVITVPLSKYVHYNTRICRPVGLTREDVQALIAYLTQRLGNTYDLKNIFDLMRYLLPIPPVPSYYRRKLLAFGSGDPTQAICSTLIAQAFQSIRYPILPRHGEPKDMSEEQLLSRRHYSHFTPRDFDLSPFFLVVKPTIEKRAFNYKSLLWKNDDEV